MGWFSSIRNESERAKVHNTTIKLIDELEYNSFFHRTAGDGIQPILTRGDRLTIFAIFMVHFRRESFYDFDMSAINFSSAMESIVEDSMDDLLDNILQVRNDKFNLQRYKIDLLEEINVVARYYIDEYMSKRIASPNLKDSKFLRDTILHFFRKRIYLSFKGIRIHIDKSYSVWGKTTNKPRK